MFVTINLKLDTMIKTFHHYLKNVLLTKIFFIKTKNRVYETKFIAFATTDNNLSNSLREFNFYKLFQ